MTVGSDETPVSGNERLHDALLSFTGCVGEAVADICSYGLTIGETYVPFRPDPEDDCEEDEEFCSQVWVRVTDISVSGGTEGWAGTCSASLTVGLEVGVVRCISIPEGGEAPEASDVMVAALQAMTDMNAIYCAAMSCEVWDSINVGVWMPSGPQGGQVGGTWTFDVEL